MAARKTKRVTTRKKTEVKSPETMSTMSTSSAPNRKTLSSKKVKMVALGVLVLALLYLGRGLFVVSVVNGKPVYRLTVLRQLERLGGSQVYDEMVRHEVVKQELAKRGLSVDEKSIEDELNQAREDFKSRGTTLEEALEQDNLTLEDLMELTRYQRGIELLANEDIQISNEDIEKYFEDNKAFMGDAKLEDSKEQIRETLKQQKSFELVENLVKNANIVTFHKY